MRKESHDTNVKWHVYEQCLSSNRIISILPYYAIFEIYAGRFPRQCTQFYERTILNKEHNAYEI